LAEEKEMQSESLTFETKTKSEIYCQQDGGQVSWTLSFAKPEDEIFLQLPKEFSRQKISI